MFEQLCTDKLQVQTLSDKLGFILGMETQHTRWLFSSVLFRIIIYLFIYLFIIYLFIYLIKVRFITKMIWTFAAQKWQALFMNYVQKCNHRCRMFTKNCSRWLTKRDKQINTIIKIKYEWP